MIGIVDDKLGVLGITIVFEIQGIAFQTAAPADDDRAFAAQFLQHCYRIEIQNRRKHKFNVINHNNTGIETMNRCGDKGNGFIRTVGTRYFQKFVIKEFTGFTNLPTVLIRQFTDELALTRTGTANNN